MSNDRRMSGHDYLSRIAKPHVKITGHLARHTLALVLAGGRGTRLKQLTQWRAKPAVPFAGKLRIIDFPLSNCVNSGVRHAAVLTQYKAQSLIRHIERGWGFLAAELGEYIDVVPAQQRVDEGWYSGTADAVYQNLELVREVDPDYVLILAADHVYKMNYAQMLAEHVDNHADATVACIEVPLTDAAGFGVMGVDDDGRISAFVEKPDSRIVLPGSSGRPDHVLVSMGIYVFDTAFLCAQLERDAADASSGHDFGKDLLPYMLERHRLFAHRFVDSCVNMVGDNPYWRDVGTIDAYWEANMDLIKVVPELNLYDEEWPILSRQPQLPPAKFVFDDDSLRGVAVDSLVSSGCIVSGATVRRSILFSKVRVGEGSLIEDSLVLPNVVIGRGVTLKRVVLDKRCILCDGFTAGVHPDEDKARFHVTEHGITLVTSSMLEGQTC
jgi:glucose-1-phosphate adenylyltransferase